MVRIYKLSLKLLELLEIVHEAGYVHNDLHLGKVVFSNKDSDQHHGRSTKLSDFAIDNPIHLMNYRFATPYIDFSTGKHLKQERI